MRVCLEGLPFDSGALLAANLQPADEDDAEFAVGVLMIETEGVREWERDFELARMKKSCEK